MIIKSFEIENFRSCKETKINFSLDSEMFCDILIGKNETGKSNILKAMNLISETSKFDYKTDVNKKAKKKSSDVDLTYKIVEDIAKSLYKNTAKIPEEIFTTINISDAEWKITYSSDGKKNQFLWVYVTDNKLYEKYIINSKTEEIQLASNLTSVAIGKDNVKILLGDDFSILTHSDLESKIESEIQKAVSEKIKRIILWKHDPAQIKLSDIPLAQFSANPSTSIPLRNMFYICGIKNIKESIELIKDDITKTESLVKILSKKSTEFINSVWPEHDISLKVRIDANNCSVLVEDIDDDYSMYSMNERSDGFKQFVSLLLSLSAEVRGNKLENNLILIDEPEVHLHPSGIRYLRDELLKLSRSNQVIISTHSIFMVDKKRLDRHHKISKNEGETSVKQIEQSNPYEEEVIYEALGTSIYEMIQPNMLIFEGKTDKDLFDVMTYKFRAELKPISHGTISADGVEKIPNFTKFMDGKLVKGFVLVDSDAAGRKIKERIKKDVKGFNTRNTFEYNDFYNQKNDRTLEDLYPIESIEEELKNTLSIGIKIDINKPVISQLKEWNKTERKKIDIEEFKHHLIKVVISDINSLTKNKTKEKYKIYYNVLQKIHSKLKK